MEREPGNEAIEHHGMGQHGSNQKMPYLDSWFVNTIDKCNYL